MQNIIHNSIRNYLLGWVQRALILLIKINLDIKIKID